MTNKKVWFVTGASKGLGLTLVRELLAAGYAVALLPPEIWKRRGKPCRGLMSVSYPCPWT